MSNPVFRPPSVEPRLDLNSPQPVLEPITSMPSSSSVDLTDPSWAGWNGYRVITTGPNESVRTLYKEYAYGRNIKTSIKTLLAIKKSQRGFRTWVDRAESTKWTKMSRIIFCVEALAKKPRWGVDKAIAHLDLLKKTYFQSSMAKMKEACVKNPKKPPEAPIRDLFALIGHVSLTSHNDYSDGETMEDTVG